MATAELARPGVEVIQQIRTSSPTFLRPTLAPVVVGPAFEVINVLTSDGTVNSKARYGSYAQLGKTITHSAFPNPRANIDEVDIIPSSIRPFLFVGGKLSELLMDPGEGFLVASHVAGKAQLVITGTSFAVQGKSLVLAVDQPTAADVTRDVTVAFPGSSPYAPADLVTVINAAFGFAVASVTVDGSHNPTGVLLQSPTFGALSSLTVRAGGTANQLLGLGWDTGNTVGREERVCGAGYRAYNLSNNTTVSPWIEFFRGDYLAGGVSNADTAWPAHAGMKNVATGVVTNGRAAAIVFGGSNMPLMPGDQIFADGMKLNSGELSIVTTSRVKLGTINTALSAADANGRYTSKVYDDSNLGLTIDTTPFAPQFVWFKATGLRPNSAATAAALTGSQAASAATAGSVQGASAPDLSGGVALAGLHIDYIVTVDGVATAGSFVFTSATPYTTMAAVAADVTIPGLVVTASTGHLAFATAKTGRLQSVTIKASSSGATALGLGGADLTATGVDASFTNLAGTNLRFSLDHGSHVYDVGFIYDSLDLAVEAINDLVGATVAAKDGLGTHLVLTSTLKGLPSLVTVVDGSAMTLLGFTAAQSSSPGAGRPNPDAFLDSSNNLVIGPEIVRDPVTGFPLDFATSQATLYVQFKGLRRDVSATAKVAGVVAISDTTTLSSVLDPITEENPLALGFYLALLNCPGYEVKGLGVDEISSAAPEGTELGYARAASFLEAEEVYSIALLTQNEVVHSTFVTHATLMSQPEQMGERIVLFNKKQPVRRSPTAVANGVSANSTATANQLLLDSTPQQGLIDAGLNPALPFTAEDGVYVEFSWNGSFFRYSVSSVSGGLANLRTSFATGENDDLFYTAEALPSGIVNASWAMKVRGPSLMVPGSNPARPDFSLVASTVAEANGGVGNRRAYSFFPDTVKTTLAGIEKEVPGYYACAVVAGMIAGLPPQQGLTNYPMTGLTGVSGTEKFTKRQLNIMAGGGSFILMQEVQSGPVFCRHQLSTDTTSVETRELSITKVVDFVAKFLRTGIRRFIGRQNINSVFLDTVGTTIQAMLQFLQDNGIINGSSLNNIIQDPANPDTVMVDVTLDVPYPCNYIRLTLVV